MGFLGGAPDRIRTCDLCLRRAALYPAELRVHSGCYRQCGARLQWGCAGGAEGGIALGLVAAAVCRGWSRRAAAAPSRRRWSGRSGRRCGLHVSGAPASLPATAAQEPAMSATADLSAAHAAGGGEAPGAEAPVPDLRTAEARIVRLLRHARVPRVTAGHGGPACGADRGGAVGAPTQGNQLPPVLPAMQEVAEGLRRRAPPPEKPAPGSGRRSCSCVLRSLKPLRDG